MPKHLLSDLLNVRQDPHQQIRFYLEQLPDGYRKLALNHKGANLEEKVWGMVKAVGFFASWYDTNQGDKFWCKVQAHYVKGTPLPPLPGTAITHAYYHKAEDVEQILELPNGVYEITVTDNGVSISAKQTDK